VYQLHITQCGTNQRLYLFNKLKHAGLDEQGLATVFQAIVVYRVLYALPA